MSDVVRMVETGGQFLKIGKSTRQHLRIVRGTAECPAPERVESDRDIEGGPRAGRELEQGSGKPIWDGLECDHHDPAAVPVGGLHRRFAPIATGEPTMTDSSIVSRRQVEVTNALGLHLRAAGRFVKLAQSFRSEIWVECRSEGKRASGKSILDLATLAAACGTTLDIVATGPDAGEAVAALVALIDSRFFEQDEG